MQKNGKGAIAMTEVLMNFENIIDDYTDKTQEKINPKLEAFFIVYRIKKLIKTKFAQKIVKDNIVKDKTINKGKATIKGTRVTPNDIGRVIERNTNVTIEKIFEELPSLEKEEQILAGLFVFMQENLTWRKVFFTR